MYLFPTFFYAGYFPYAPGTLGSLLALVIGCLVLKLSSAACLIVLTLVFTVVYFITATRLLAYIKQPDPQIIVADEVIGQWAVLLFLPDYGTFNLFLALLFFRVFDILKPFPVNWFDNKSKTGTYFSQSVYILADDLMASFYSITCIYLINICKTYLLLNS